MLFGEKYFWSQKFLSDLQIAHKFEKTKKWPNTAVKMKLINFNLTTPQKMLGAPKWLGRFFAKKFFQKQKIMLFGEKYFFASKISVGPPNLPQIEECKLWLNSAVKCQIIFFLKIIPKTKVYAERRYGAFFCQKFFSQTKSNVYSREIFFGCRNFCGTSKFAPNWENSKCD